MTLCNISYLKEIILFLPLHLDFFQRFCYPLKRWKTEQTNVWLESKGSKESPVDASRSSAVQSPAYHCQVRSHWNYQMFSSILFSLMLLINIQVYTNKKKFVKWFVNDFVLCYVCGYDLSENLINYVRPRSCYWLIN